MACSNKSSSICYIFAEYVDIVICIFSQHYFFVVIVFTAILNRSRKSLLWKGRNIYGIGD